MAFGIAIISGQAALISSRVKINLLSLRASRDNFELFYCRALEDLSGGDVITTTMFGKMSTNC